MRYSESALTIRRLGASDDAEVARLAELDSSDAPAGPMLGAEVEGRLLAAISLSTGESIADPFSHTEELRGVLELRAAQLRAREQGARRRHLRPARERPGGAPAGVAARYAHARPRIS